MDFTSPPGPEDATPDSSAHPFSKLSPDAVLDAAEQLGYLPDGRLLALNSYENRVYRIGLEDAATPVIFKFYRPQRWCREQIEEEHQFTQQLAENDLPVVPPLSLNGSTLHEIDGFLIAIFPLEPGRPPEFDNLDNLLVMGRLLGRIHAFGATAEFAHRPVLSVARLGEASREFLLSGDFLPADLRDAYDSLSRDLLLRLNQLDPADSKRCAIRLHGDCHGGNVLWRDGGPHFVDFDDCLSGPAIQDLWMLLSGDRDQRQGQLLELVEGYNEFADFRASELDLVECLRSLRLMHYAAWLARRWQDPAFPQSFPWFNTPRYWAEHILELREQLALLDEPPLRLMTGL